jgi:radical SAM protein (TIGR01212 family)
VASTNSHASSTTEPVYDWRGAGLRYFQYNYFLRQRFGERVQKVSIDAGFTCPNVDGTITTGGCNFCDNRSFSPSRRTPRLNIVGQIDDGIRRLKRRYDCDAFIAYFQPATNTYGSLEKLKNIYSQALSHEKVIGLAIGTRSDCVPNEVLDLIQEYAQQHYVAVEYGLQTIHDRSLEWMNRGHDYASFLDAVERSRNRGFEVCAHVILGIPGETHDDMLATAREVARLPIHSVKLHNLYAVKRTPLGEQVQRGEVQLIERDDYIRTLVDFLEILPPGMIVERISGDAPPDYFIGPSWCLDKPAVKLALHDELLRRDSWQGKLYSPI